jgi:hypothetical protein
MRTLLCLLCLALSSCVTVRYLQVEPVDATVDDTVAITSPVKVHLVDGGTVVFEKGINVAGGKITGEGFRYDVALELRDPVVELSLDDVAAMESFQTPVNTGATAAASTGATAAGGAGGLMFLKLIFGSCPTIYSLQADEPILEAESFSYSIAPGFERRDVDRLGIDPGSTGSIELELRNEALETHYINQVELLSVEHGPDDTVYTDNRSQPLIVRDLQAPVSAMDNSGRRADRIVAAADGVAWRSRDTRLEQVSGDDFRDTIDFSFAAPLGGGSTALVLRLRNSLLNTVLFYDVMLQGQGLHAIDWMGRDLTRLGSRYRLARWYNETMGLRVLVWQDGDWQEIAAAGDTGPIAWKDIAVRLPESRGETVRVRLSFVADNWRIDRVSLGTIVSSGKFQRVPLQQIIDRDGAVHDAARENLHRSDRRYVITKPGDRLLLQFDAGLLRADRQHTFFLAATGYYIEWMRRDWLETTTASTFVPGDAAVIDALSRWRTQRESMRELFDATRINVR